MEDKPCVDVPSQTDPMDPPAQEEGVIVLQELTLRVEEALDALRAIRKGQVDALVISPTGNQEVVLLQGADIAYRVLFETLNEGALAIAANSGYILYANRRFAELVGESLDHLLGQMTLSSFVAPEEVGAFTALLEGARSKGGKGELHLITKQNPRLPVMMSIRSVETHKGSGEGSYTVVVSDLTPIKEAHAAREAVERRYRDIVETALEGIWQIDLEMRIEFVNNRMVELLGYSAAELCGQALLSLVVPRERHGAEEQLRRIFSGNRAFFDTQLTRSDGSTLWVIMTGSPLLDAQSAVQGALGMITDITPRKQIEETLRRSESQLVHAQELAHMGSWVWYFDEDRYDWSNELYRIFGAEPGSVISWPILLELVHPDDREKFERLAFQTIRTGELFTMEYRVIHPGGAERIVSARGHVLPPSGSQPARMVGIARDVTDERAMERRLRAAINEKEVLLKEAHHRVKNNLQVISSLLGLQGRQLADPVARDVLREAESRVQSIALVHETIYKSKDIGLLDLSAYIRRLIGVVQSMYSGAELLEIAVDVGPIRLGIDTAVQCGLIVHELVTNALKHAFVGRKDGRVWISMHRVNESDLALEVGDNGVGLPVNVDMHAVRTLGLRLVCRLTAQLGGEITLTREGGTRFTIRFPDPCSVSVPRIEMASK